MYEICNKIFYKSENRGIARKFRGGLRIFFLQGGLVCFGEAGKILLYRGDDPLGGLENLGGAEYQLQTMRFPRHQKD